MIGRVPVGVVADVTLGKMLQPRPNKPQDVLRPYLRAAHVQPNGVLDLGVELKEMWFAVDELDGLGIRAGDVLVVEGGAVGRSTYIASDMPGVGFQNALLRVRPRKTKSDGRYLNYSLQSAVLSGEVATFCDSVSIPHFTAEKVARFRVPYHDIDIQKRIADYLDRETGEIDAMLAKMDELTETLEERRISMIQSHAGIGDTGLRSSIRSLQWVASFATGSTPAGGRDANFAEAGGVGWVTPEDLGSTIMPTRFLNEAGAKQVPLVPAGSVLLCAIGATLGKVGFTHEELTTNQQITAIVPDRCANGRYLYYSILAEKDQIVANSMTTTLPIINNARLREIRVRVPGDADEQRRIADHLDEVTGKIDQMLAKTAELKSLLIERRSALITDVVTGKKQVHS